MANPYSYANLGTVRQQLANRLFDSSMVFWNSAELTLLIQEALRTWNALTSYWRGDFPVTPQSGVTWYDLTDTTNLPNTLRPYTLFDTDLYTAIQYHLLEPIAWNPWTGVSAQFTADDLLNAVQRRRDEILSVTGCTINRRVVAAIAGRTQLPDTVIDVRRMAYLPTTTGAGGYGSGTYGTGIYGMTSGGSMATNSVVWPDDTWAEQAFNRNYLSLPAGSPSTYLMSTEPPISFDTDIAPGFGGNYELLTVEAGALLAVGTPSHLLIPDDWLHILKWGALADLFGRESNAKDPLRATYCETRYRMGLQLLSNASALLAMRIGTTPLQIDSVRSMDLYQTSWQAQANNTPNIALQSGLNMIALAPAPDVGTYTVTATVVQNAIVPVNSGDNVQVARDDLDAILDYAQHLASFKMGGAEFLSTMPLMKRFLQQAAIYGLKLNELGEYTSILYGLSQREASSNPVLAGALPQ